MSGKRIAIIGSCDPNRAEELELNPKTLNDAKQAGEDIGFALAENGYTIDVYSSDEHMFEVDVVRGFAKSSKAQPKSIRVFFSTNQEPPTFAEQAEHFDLFDPEPERATMDEWEVSFYSSIAKVDGVILLGGGSSTLIAGLVALGHQKPVLTLGMFGGAAFKVWKVLGINDKYIPEFLIRNDWDDMSFSRMWSKDVATQLVQGLNRQFAAHQKKVDDTLNIRQQEIEDAKQSIRLEFNNSAERKRKARLYTILAVPMFISIFVLWGYSQSLETISVPRMYSILIFSALASGVVGSSMRVVFNRFLGITDIVIPDLLESVFVGLVSGGLAAGMFVTAQTNALNTLDLTSAELARQLKPLVFNVALIGIVGGVGIETVWNNLKSADPFKPSQSFSSVQPNPDNPNNGGV